MKAQLAPQSTLKKELKVDIGTANSMLNKHRSSLACRSLLRMSRPYTIHLAQTSRTTRSWTLSKSRKTINRTMYHFPWRETAHRMPKIQFRGNRLVLGIRFDQQNFRADFGDALELDLVTLPVVFSLQKELTLRQKEDIYIFSSWITNHHKL